MSTAKEDREGDKNMWEPNPYDDQDPFEPGQAGPPEPLWAREAAGETEPSAPDAPAPAPLLKTSGSEPLLAAVALETAPAVPAVEPVEAAGVREPETSHAPIVTPAFTPKLDHQAPRTVLRRLSELSVAPIRVDSHPAAPGAVQLPPEVSRMEQALAGLEQQLNGPRTPVSAPPAMPNLMERIRAARLKAEQARSEAVTAKRSLEGDAPAEGESRAVAVTVPVEVAVGEVRAAPLKREREGQGEAEASGAEAGAGEAGDGQAGAGEAVTAETEPVTLALSDDAPVMEGAAGHAVADEAVADEAVADEAVADEAAAEEAAAEEAVAEVVADEAIAGAAIADAAIADAAIADTDGAALASGIEAAEWTPVETPAVTEESDASRAEGGSVPGEPGHEAADEFSVLPDEPEFLAGLEEPPVPLFADAHPAPAEEPGASLWEEEPALPAFLSSAEPSAAGRPEVPEAAIPDDLLPPLPAVLSGRVERADSVPLLPPTPPVDLGGAAMPAETRAAKRHLESLAGIIDVEINEGLTNLNTQVGAVRPLGLSSTASRQRQNTGAGTERFVVFSMNGARYGLPIGEVLEMANVPRTTPLPNAPEFIRGIANLRGEVLAVIDLRVLLAVEAPADALRERMIVVRSPQSDAVAGLIVDSVRGLARLGTGDILQPASPVEDRVADFLQGVASHEDQVLNVLDTRKLFAAPEMMTLAAV